jgi:predicted O-methyltransferase YrrM
MKLAHAEFMYDLVTSRKLSVGLELGFYHGVSTAYIAGALQDASEAWRLTTIDLLNARDRQPNIEEVLANVGLADRITVYFEPRSYTWRLMKLLEDGKYGKFDFCYIDGGHTWDNTGFGLSLVALLLKPGGWVVLDDLHWTPSSSPALRDRPSTSRLSGEELNTAAVEKVFELLVRRDSRFKNAFEWRGWGIAQRV